MHKGVRRATIWLGIAAHSNRVYNFGCKQIYVLSNGFEPPYATGLRTEVSYFAHQ